MAQNVSDVMTPDPVTLPMTASLSDAAVAMRDHEIGDVIVLRDQEPCGIVTDRDIVVRAVAEGRSDGVSIGDICTGELVSVSPSDPIDRAVDLMRQRAIRRLPVVENGQAVGMVSLGDLAIERNEGSTLAEISRAPANNE
jgi:signal-transduction protein with cAMP-binding, CBS, and nucleotidyltransferase domain